MRGLHGPGAQGGEVAMGEGNYRPGGVIGSGHRADHFDPRHDELPSDWTDDVGAPTDQPPRALVSQKTSKEAQIKEGQQRREALRGQLGHLLLAMTDLDEVRSALDAAKQAGITHFTLSIPDKGSKQYHVDDLIEAANDVGGFRRTAAQTPTPIRRAAQEFFKQHSS